MEFQAVIDYVKKDYVQFARLHRKLRYKVFYLIFWILETLALLLLLSGAVLLSVADQWSGEMVRLYALLAVFLLVWLILRYIKTLGAFKTLTRGGVYRLTTLDKGLHIASEKIASDYSYDAFSEIIHYRNAYYLYIDKHRAVILPERCFTEGDPAAFGAFISEKCGLKMKELK